MKTSIISIFLITILFSLSGCLNPTQDPTPTPASTPSFTPEFTQSPTPTSTATGLTESEAKAIAEATCIQEGESLAPGYYNEGTKTWWFDATVKEPKEGCNPACVVSEDTKTAEINWRCTGLIPPTDGASTELKALFGKKYPQYQQTLKITVDYEAENHVRGSISMEPGAPGGIFLAVKDQTTWRIVHEGNGEIPCELKELDFPSEMLSDCAE